MENTFFYFLNSILVTVNVISFLNFKERDWKRTVLKLTICGAGFFLISFAVYGIKSPLWLGVFIFICILFWAWKEGQVIIFRKIIASTVIFGFVSVVVYTGAMDNRFLTFEDYRRLDLLLIFHWGKLQALLLFVFIYLLFLSYVEKRMCEKAKNQLGW